MEIVDGVTDELIARAKAGDRDAFNELVRHTYKRVHAVAVRLTDNEQDADDVVQDTYVRAFRSLRRFRGDARFTTWLHRIATNTAFTLHERRTRHTHGDIDAVPDVADISVDADPEASAEVDAVGARLISALNGLPSRLRSVVVLRDVHGMSHREIADELEITESAAKVRLHRARARLRDVLSRDAALADDDRVVALRRAHQIAHDNRTRGEDDPLQSAS